MYKNFYFAYTKTTFIVLFLISFKSTLYSEQSIKTNYPKSYFPPVVGASAIIEAYDDEDNFLGIVLIKRGKAPYGMALPAGKIEYHEEVGDDENIAEIGVRREVKEETNLEIYDVKLNTVYSPKDEQFAFPLIEINFTAKTKLNPTAGDDAAEAYIIKLEDIPWSELINRHQIILKDYLPEYFDEYYLTNTRQTNPLDIRPYKL